MEQTEVLASTHQVMSVNAKGVERRVTEDEMVGTLGVDVFHGIDGVDATNV